jgi:hypothetical protein
LLDELSVLEYKYIEQKYKEIIQSIHIDSSTKCLLCNHTKKVTINEASIMDDIIISTNLASYYKTVANMKMKLNFSINEIESMMPFELEVYDSLCVDIANKQVGE